MQIAGMWQYSSLGSEGGSVGPSTSSVHPSPGHQSGSAAAAVAAAAAAQPELTDMLNILDQSTTGNFDDLNMFNTTFE